MYSRLVTAAVELVSMNYPTRARSYSIASYSWESGAQSGAFTADKNGRTSAPKLTDKVWLTLAAWGALAGVV